MIKNFKNNKLTESILSGGTAIAVIAGIGIIATPARAGQLGWSDGTSDFFDDVNPVAGDIFSVTFSPDSLGGLAAVFSASDEFAPFFDTPELIALTPPPTGNFEFVTGLDPVDGIFQEFQYELTNDLVFNFDTDGNENASGNEVLLTIGAGSTFQGEFNENPPGGSNPLGVEFESLEIASVIVTTGDQTFSLGNPNFPVDELTFQFGDIPSQSGGEYNGLVSVTTRDFPQPNPQEPTTVPEPASILGLLAVGGLGVAMKRKKQSKQPPV
ncbi:MAG: PEP-CTERM sorting domain-containing protein [Xenococcaceae cyanobacterium MO_167.B27]|nr:PEP-CTERM sorting domain-containing protein [Xenococcaceae cyanobacterium MO_167.B27]